MLDATESAPLLPAYDVRRSQEVQSEILGKVFKDSCLIAYLLKSISFIYLYIYIEI